MLPIGIDDEHPFAYGASDAGFHGGAVPFVVRMSDDSCTGGGGPVAGVIVRTVVDDEDLLPGGGAAQGGHDGRDRAPFVEGRDDDRRR